MFNLTHQSLALDTVLLHMDFAENIKMIEKEQRWLPFLLFQQLHFTHVNVLCPVLFQPRGLFFNDSSFTAGYHCFLHSSANAHKKQHYVCFPFWWSKTLQCKFFSFKHRPCSSYIFIQHTFRHSYFPILCRTLSNTASLLCWAKSEAFFLLPIVCHLLYDICSFGRTTVLVNSRANPLWAGRASLPAPLICKQW